MRVMVLALLLMAGCPPVQPQPDAGWIQAPVPVGFDAGCGGCGK